jgi:putative holliday junction resolvase
VATNLLGIDYGSQRVGVALSVDGRSPQRLVTLDQDEQLWERLEQLSAAHQVEQIVIGLPRSTDGEDSAWTAQVRQLAGEVESRLGLPVVLQDEFGTSQAARERLGTKLSPVERRALVDQESAVIILEDYLRDR